MTATNESVKKQREQGTIAAKNHLTKFCFYVIDAEKESVNSYYTNRITVTFYRFTVSIRCQKKAITGKEGKKFLKKIIQVQSMFKCIVEEKGEFNSSTIEANSNPVESSSQLTERSSQ